MGASSYLMYTGFLLIVHAGFSTAHWRWMVGAAAAEHSTPLDIYLELACGFVAAMTGAILNAGPFKGIRTSTSTLSKGPCPDFYVYNHRGVALRKRQLKAGRLDID
jgi:hypothetical protein